MALENGDGPSALDKKVIRQIEYYFGDMNLPRDKFLQEKVKEDDGWVSMDVMLKFNRLRTISEDREYICKALRKSSSGLMEVNEDFTKIRRSPSKPLPDNTKERKDDINARSVYVKGLPEDSTLDLLQEYFEQHGKIDSIFMRRGKEDKSFKGSVFVTFSDKEEEKTFLAKEGVKYNETELVKMTKEEFYKKKAEEAKELRKSTQADSEKKEALEAEKKKERDEKKVEDQMTKGAVLFMKGLSSDTAIDDIRTFFSQYGTVGWVEFATGDDKALVRFSEAEAQAAMDKAKAAGDGKVVLKECELELRVLEGEEEKEYWRKMFKDVADRIYQRKNRGSQPRKRKGGHHSSKRGQKDTNADDGEPSAKKQKSEDDAE